MQNADRIEFLKRIDIRLTEVETEKGRLVEEIQVKEARVRVLLEEQQHLTAVKNLHQNGEPSSATGVIRPADGEVRDRPRGVVGPLLELPPVDGPPAGAYGGARAWKAVVVTTLQRSGKAMHYADLAEHLRRHGLPFGGQNPAASFLATLARDPEFQRVGRGMYWFADTPVPVADAKPRVRKGRRRRAVIKRTGVKSNRGVKAQ